MYYYDILSVSLTHADTELNTKKSCSLYWRSKIIFLIIFKIFDIQRRRKAKKKFLNKNDYSINLICNYSNNIPIGKNKQSQMKLNVVQFNSKN